MLYLFSRFFVAKRTNRRTWQENYKCVCVWLRMILPGEHVLFCKRLNLAALCLMKDEQKLKWCMRSGCGKVKAKTMGSGDAMSRDNKPFCGDGGKRNVSLLFCSSNCVHLCDALVVGRVRNDFVLEKTEKQGCLIYSTWHKVLMPLMISECIRRAFYFDVVVCFKVWFKSRYFVQLKKELLLVFLIISTK